MANPKKVALCHECHEQLKTANYAKLTPTQQEFVSSERAALEVGVSMKVEPGQCNQCAIHAEVIHY